MASERPRRARTGLSLKVYKAGVSPKSPRAAFGSAKERAAFFSAPGVLYH